jgi:hypothetical protein
MGLDGTPGSPGLIYYVVVNWAKCDPRHHVKKDSIVADKVARLLQIVAHELGHGVGMAHHGDGGNHTHNSKPKPVDVYLKHSLTSGNDHCIMRYDHHGQGWCDRPAEYKDKKGKPIPIPPKENVPENVNNTNNCHLYPPGGDPLGDSFCDSSAGTGVNRGNDAAQGRGNCIGQMRVKDW